MFLYLLVSESDYKNIIILITKDDAISASKEYPTARVEIFAKNTESRYTPTYNYYQNGIFFDNQSGTSSIV